MLVAIAMLLLANAAPAATTMVTEVFALGYRSVAEMTRALRPLVPAPGAVSGLDGQLVVRTDAATLESLRGLIARLDRAPRNLLVSLSRHANAEIERDLAAWQGRVSSGANGTSAAIGARVRSTQRDRRDHEVQRVRVLEGRDGYIASGVAVPVAERRTRLAIGGAQVEEQVRYVDVSRGMWVRVRGAGEDRVHVAIAARRDQIATTGGGAIDTGSTVTEVDVPLGHWVRLGGIDRSATSTGSGISASTRSRSERRQSLYLRVDVLP